jgi:PAS domain S-box-containing protein
MAGAAPVTAPPRTRRFVSLRTKFVLAAVLVTILLMATVMAVVERRQRAAVIEEVQRRGTVLAESLASMATGPLLLYNFTALEQAVARLDAQADDVTYAVVVDAEGVVAAHSRAAHRVGDRDPDEAAARALAADGLLIQEVHDARGEALYEFAVPILVERQRWGTVRVGLSRARMERQIARTRRELVGLAAVAIALGAVAAAIVARRVARPVSQLADAATAIARGDLLQRIEPAASDEIGRLAGAFNHMADQLGAQRADLGRAHDELARRFAELSDLKRYTDDVLGSLTSGIVTLDLEGRVVTLNATAESLTGGLAAQVRGRLATEAFAHLPGLCEVLLSTLTSRVGTGLASTTLARPRGGAIPVEISTSSLTGADGRGLGVVAVLRDVSAVRQLEEQLRRSDRLAAVGTLAAGLAHEIKNPLTSVLTFSRHLPRRFADERFRQRFQNVVPRELERINRIVEDLLRLARPGRLTLAPVHVPDLLDRTLELYAQQAESKRVTVLREYTLGLPPIAADPEYLYQALVNLVANGLEAMDEGGQLTVRAGWAGDEGGGSGPAAGRALLRDRLRIDIEDTGAGIPAAESGSVFNPFFTTKPTGTGLGLAITHKIIEDHGGSITFRSAPGRGTTFTVVLPVAGMPALVTGEGGARGGLRSRELGGA